MLEDKNALTTASLFAVCSSTNDTFITKLVDDFNFSPKHVPNAFEVRNTILFQMMVKFSRLVL